MKEKKDNFNLILPSGKEPAKGKTEVENETLNLIKFINKE